MNKQEQYEAKTAAFNAYKALKDAGLSSTDPERAAAWEAYETAKTAFEATCEGHPAGPNDPVGQTVYCDGTCINR